MKYIKYYCVNTCEMIQSMISDASVKRNRDVIKKCYEISDILFKDIPLKSRFVWEHKLPMPEWSDQFNGDEPEAWRATND